MKKLITFLMLILLPAFSYAGTIKIKAEADITGKVLKGTIDGKPFSCPLVGDGHDFILMNWYEHMNMSSVELELSLPNGYIALAEADRAFKTEKGWQFYLKHTDKPMVLSISDRWQVKSVNYKGVEIAVYFSGQNIQFSDVYLDRIKVLYDRYVKLFGEYPYGRFAVADVPYPAGHALISLTFISDRIVSMPFMLETSLGHEFVHQWMGVAVDTVADAGNWAEAMTTYLADRQYEDVKALGAEYRKNALLTVMQHTNQKEDGTCLLGFEYNKGKKSQAIGYSKGMMVFEMLKTITGDKFDDGLRLFYKRNKFKQASWEDLQKAFEDTSDRKLGDFFNGWLSETALAEFDIDSLNVKGTVGGYSTEFSIKNRYEWLNYPLEITVKTEKTNIQKTIYIDKKEENFNIESGDRPISMTIDADYKTARILDRSEVYPVLHGLMSDKKKAVFVNKEDMSIYSDILAQIDNAEVYDNSVTPYGKTDKVLIFLGRNNDALKKFYSMKDTDSKAEFSAEAFLNPASESTMIYRITAKDSDALRRGMSRLSHYGKYTSLTVIDGKTFTNTKNSDTGIVINLYDEKQGARVNNSLSIKDIINENSDASAYFIGESHTAYAHHQNQMEMVKSLYEAGKNVAVGLEMVQYPFQKYLDDYIAGKIDEKAMLKGVEYYDRWRYDFRMYRPVFKYALEHKIPLVALNTPREITQKVSAGGLKSLTDEELLSIPAEIEFTDGRYRDFLYGVFAQHKMGDFNNFYEAQLLWDETMAQKSAEYIKANPDRTLVVLAGNGHISYKEAIPERFKRRAGKKYVAVVQDEEPRQGIADYVLYPSEMNYDESPKLGVMLTDEDNKLIVREISEKTPAEKAGIKKDDVLIRFNGVELKSLSDLKLELLYAEQNREYALTVLRNGKETVLFMEF